MKQAQVIIDPSWLMDTCIEHKMLNKKDEFVRWHVDAATQSLHMIIKTEQGVEMRMFGETPPILFSLEGRQ